VGICITAGDLGAAGGAALLFVTNLVAILVAGGGVLALMGYGAVARQGVKAEGRRKAALVTGLALVVVAVPLALTSLRLAQDAILEATARTETEAWLSGSGYEVVGVSANDQTLTITIDGSGAVPSPEQLAAEIGRLRPGLRLAIRAVAAQRFSVVARPAP
jgi:uncharacterized membrane protein